MNRFSRELFLVIVLMVIMMLSDGCKKEQGFLSSQDGIVFSEELSEEKLRIALDKYEEFFMATVEGVSAKIDELSPEEKTHKSTLNLKEHTLGACRKMLALDDPQVAFIESWILAVRLGEYFKSGEGSNLFGEHQGLVIDAIGLIQEHISGIGKDFFDGKTFVTAQDKVYKFSRSNPIKKDFVQSDIIVSESMGKQSSLFEDLIDLPIAPVKVFGSATGGVTGIHQLSGAANHFSDVVEALPESTRRQSVLLIQDMEKTEMVKSALANMGEFSKSSSMFAESVEKLPAQLREEISTLIEDIDTKQSNLQATIDRALTLVAEVDELSSHLNLRVMQLIVLIFALALAYRVAVVRFICKPVNKPEE